MFADEGPGAQNDRLSLQRTTKFCHSEGIFDARGNPFPCGSKSCAMLCIAKMRIATVALLPRNDVRYSIVR